MSTATDTTQSAFERTLARAAEQKYVLRLYVTGATERSTRAVSNLRTLCDRYLAGRYELEVVDVYQQRLLAVDGHILAAPTLVKSAPLPVRRLIGDLSDVDKVVAALDIHTR